MPRIERQAILDRFHDMVRRREPIIGGGAGTGLSAKCEEAGGIDLIVIYNSGRYRMAGRGSAAGLLAYGNANEIVREMAPEVLPAVSHTPVLAGVNGTDPFVLMPQFLAELKAMGFSGVQNFPTVGLFDGTMRASFEETGMGYGLEVDMIAAAHRLDLLTTPYVFNADEAAAMVQAGADIVVAHMGVTTGGSVGARSARSLAECAEAIDAIAAAALAVRRDVIVLCHGGPIALPEDAQSILARCPDCHGFYGASSMERLPVETALTAQTRRFKAIRRDGMEEEGMQGRFMAAAETQPETLDWGELRWLSSPPATGARQLTVIEVRLAPGKGHDFHRHAAQEEVLYVAAGQVEQWVDREMRLLGPGDSAFVPAGTVHASFNAGAGEARIVAILGPCAGAQGYELEEVAGTAPWNGLRG